MPPSGVDAKPRKEILRLEEVLDVAKIALRLGFSKIRLTGGEPLLRKGLIPFIKTLNLLPGLKDLALTTNGLLLPQLAGELHVAGVHRLCSNWGIVIPGNCRGDNSSGLPGSPGFFTIWLYHFAIDLAETDHVEIAC
jgi:hypothetical protein